MQVTAIKSWRVLALVLFGTFAISAQTPPAAALRLTATTQNVSGAGEAIKVTISNWSTAAQTNELIAAWMLTNASAPGAAAGSRGARGAGRGAAAGRGARGARGGRGTAPGADAPGPDLPPDPDAVDPDNPAFRFGRGGARGGAADAAPSTPEASLAAALKKAPTLGVIWTSETVGYSIKYANREQRPEGGERIILATDRRVGAWSNLWKPTATGPATDYAFSIIEFRLNAAGEGEGRGVVFGKVAVDGQVKTIGLDSYNTLPVIFKGVKRQSEH